MTSIFRFGDTRGLESVLFITSRLFFDMSATICFLLLHATTVCKLLMKLATSSWKINISMISSKATEIFFQSTTHFILVIMLYIMKNERDHKIFVCKNLSLFFNITKGSKWPQATEKETERQTTAITDTALGTDIQSLTRQVSPKTVCAVYFPNLTESLTGNESLVII